MIASLKQVLESLSCSCTVQEGAKNSLYSDLLQIQLKA